MQSEKAQTYQREYRKKNRDKVNASFARWYAANKLRLQAAARVRWEEHKERINAKRRAWCAANRPTVAAAAKKRRSAPGYNARRPSSKEHSRRYRALYPEKAKASSIASREKHKDAIKARQKIYRKKGKEKRAAYYKAWYKRTDYFNKRKLTDPCYKLLCNYRVRVHHFLKGGVKSMQTRELVGCSLPELKVHLEQQFTEGMTWDNYGKWHVDHIIPCATFRPATEESMRKCFHFSNLQPLWALDNLRKGSRLPSSKKEVDFVEAVR